MLSLSEKNQHLSFVFVSRSSRRLRPSIVYSKEEKGRRDLRLMRLIISPRALSRIPPTNSLPSPPFCGPHFDLPFVLDILSFTSTLSCSGGALEFLSSFLATLLWWSLFSAVMWTAANMEVHVRHAPVDIRTARGVCVHPLMRGDRTAPDIRTHWVSWRTEAEGGCLFLFSGSLRVNVRVSAAITERGCCRKWTGREKGVASWAR